MASEAEGKGKRKETFVIYPTRHIFGWPPKGDQSGHGKRLGSWWERCWVLVSAGLTLYFYTGGLKKGQPIGCISLVRHGETMAFAGCHMYIVVNPYRVQGHGENISDFALSDHSYIQEKSGQGWCQWGVLLGSLYMCKNSCKNLDFISV